MSDLSDPKDLPSWEEVEASGTADWVEQAMKQHQEKSRARAAALGDEREAHRKEKEALKGALELPPDRPDPEAPPADIFAAEREAHERQRRGMAGLVGDMQKSGEEQRALFDIFGSDEKKPKKRQ